MNLRKRSRPDSFYQRPKKQKTASLSPQSPLASLFHSHSFEVEDIKIIDYDYPNDESALFLDIPAQLLLNWLTELRDHNVLDFKLSGLTVFTGFGGLLLKKDVLDNVDPFSLQSPISVVFAKKEKDSVSLFLVVDARIYVNVFKQGRRVELGSFCVCLNEELALLVMKRLRKPVKDKVWADFVNSAKSQYPELSQIEVKNGTLKPFISVNEKQALCMSIVYYGIFGFQMYLMQTVVRSNKTFLVMMYVRENAVTMVTLDITDIPFIFKLSDLRGPKTILPFNPKSLEKINEVLVKQLDTDFKTVSSFLQPLGWKMNHFISGGLTPNDSAQYINVCKGPDCSFVLVIHSNLEKGEHDFDITKQLQNTKANGKSFVPKLFSGKMMLRDPPLLMFIVEELERKLNFHELRSSNVKRDVDKILDELYKNKIHHGQENQEYILLAKDGRLVIMDFRNAKVGKVKKGKFMRSYDYTGKH